MSVWSTQRYLRFESWNLRGRQVDDKTTILFRIFSTIHQVAEAMERPHPSHRKRWKFRLMLISLGVLTGLVIGEFALRIVAPQRLSPLLAWVKVPGVSGVFERDDEFGWRMVPGYDGPYRKDTHVHINSLGLRDHEYAAKQPQEIRILSLGDSYAFGNGVELEASYAKRLEAKLNEHSGHTRLHVINAGVDGYSTIQATQQLERLLPIIQPDFVIATFVAGNDVADNAIIERQKNNWATVTRWIFGAS